MSQTTEPKLVRRKRGANGGKSRFSMLRRCLTTLSADHSADDLRAGLIDCWLTANRVPHHRLAPDSACHQRIDAVPAKSTLAISRRLYDAAPNLTLKDLELAFEQLLDDRRSKGTVYTPQVIIDYMLQHAMESCGSSDHAPVVCDPACGSGGFLTSAALHLSARFGISLNRAVERFIVGIDKDPEAAMQARCSIELLLAQHAAAPVAPRILNRDTLLDSPGRLWEAAGVDGFDVVATNPPYVKLQNLAPGYRKQLIKRYGAFIKGNFSLALLFLIAGHRLLSAAGQLAYITQNNLFTSLAGEPVRRFLQDRGSLRRIVDFGHVHVFDAASAYTCLLFLGRENSTEFEFGRVCQTPTRDVLAGVRFSSIPATRLDARKWRLAPRRHLDNLHKIESTGRPLGKLAHIRVGFATLCDAVFVVRQRDGKVLATPSDDSPIAIEPEATRPAVKIADLTGELDLALNQARVIFPYVREAGKCRVLPAQDFARRFPRAWQYLCDCRDLLERRDKGKPNPDGWYAWGRAQSRDAPGPKLLTKTFDSRPRFMLDQSDQLFFNGYAVSLKNAGLSHPLPIEALQRILNSKVMHYYARLTSFQIVGGYQCYQKNFIEPLGIPDFDADQIEALLQIDEGNVDALLAEWYGVALGDIEEVVDLEDEGGSPAEQS